MSGKVLLAGLPLLAVSALVAWQADRLPLKGPVIGPDAQPTVCEVPLKFKVAFPDGDSSLQSTSAGVQSHVFMGNSWLTADTCQSGTLRVVGEGQVVGGAAPQLQVALNSNVIWAGAFSDKREVLIRIPRAGHLTLGYFNDFYRSEYRNAMLEQLKLTAKGCDTFEMDVPAEAGGTWNAQARSVGWLFAPSLTLKPCAAGTLQFRASGRPAAGKSATLEFSQGGAVLRKVQLKEAAQPLSLAIENKPLRIRILDPYFKELGDRNLTLREIHFSPGR